MSKENHEGGKAKKKAWWRVFFFSVLLILVFGAGVAVGRYALPRAEAVVAEAEGTTIRDVARLSRYAPALVKSVVFGAVAVVCTALICAAHLLKPRRKKD